MAECENNKLQYLIQDYPCLLYILRQITDATQMKTFLRSIVCLFDKLEKTTDETYDMCTALLLNQANNIMDKTFSMVDIHNKSKSDWCENIRKEDIAEYRSCSEFYSKYDSACSACPACPLSSCYCNGTLANELALIYYCLTDKENYNKVLEKGITKDAFIGQVILDTLINSKKPILYNPCQTIFALLNTSEDFAFGEKLWVSALSEYLASSIGSLSAVRNNHVWTTQMIQAKVKLILDTLCPEPLGTAISLDEAMAAVLQNDPSSINLSSLSDTETRRSQQGIAYAEHTNLETNLDSYYDSTTTNNTLSQDCISLSIENVISDLANILPEVAEETEPITLPEESTEPAKTEEKPAEEIGSDTTADATQRAETATETAEEIKDDPAAGTFTEDDIPEESQSAEEQGIPLLEQHGEIEISELTMPAWDYQPYGDSLVAVPEVSYDELSHFALALDNASPRLLTMLETSVLKDKRMAVELVHTNKGYLFLAYAPKLHSYFYFTMGASLPATDIMASLLSYRSVEKCCYMPYMLVSTLRRLGYRLRNLQSLYSASAIMMPEHQLPMVSFMESIEANKAVGGVTIYPKGEIDSPILQYMHCFCNRMKYTRQVLQRKGLLEEFKLQNDMDLVLSYSYLHAGNAGTLTALFRLTSAGKYHFFNEISYDASMPVYCIHIKHAPLDTSMLLSKLLSSLFEDGTMEKNNVTLLSMGNHFVTYQIPAKSVSRFDAKMHQTFLVMLRAEGTRGLEYTRYKITDTIAFPAHYFS